MLKSCIAVLLLTVASSQAHAETTKDKSSPAIRGNQEKPIMLTNAQAWKIYERYLEGWKAVSDEQRAKLAADIIAADVQYLTPRHDLSGRATILEDMAAFQKRTPGGHFAIGDVSANHDAALLTWVMVQSDGKVLAKGHDQIRVSADGKIVNVITFAPSVEKP